MIDVYDKRNARISEALRKRKAEEQLTEGKQRATKQAHQDHAVP
jgi:hypothetical protein